MCGQKHHDSVSKALTIISRRRVESIYDAAIKYQGRALRCRLRGTGSMDGSSRDWAAKGHCCRLGQ